MLPTIEAEIDVNGNVTLLEPIKVKRKSRAIVTLLESEIVKTELSDAEKQLAEERFARHFGAIKSGDRTSADNEKLDADLIRILEDTHDDE